MSDNKMLEEREGAADSVKNMTKEEIRMNDRELLAGLIEAGQEIRSEEFYERIEIKRNGKLKFAFRIRPLTEDESEQCREHASKFAPRKKGEPKRRIEVDASLYRSWLIYTATVDEDRERLWDNQEAQRALDVLQGVEMIDRVLLQGEKERVLGRIDDISGYDEDLEETAKN